MPGVLALAALAALVSLGNWQVSRLGWKQDLIARVQARPIQQALAIDGQMLEGADDQDFIDKYEYRNAFVTGQYDPAGEVLVFTSLSDANGAFNGPGYWVLTPFLTSENKPIYINRGFVPEARKRAYAPAPLGQVTLRGLIRAPEHGSWFTPEPDLQQRIFFARDPARLAALTGMAGAENFFVDLAAVETPPGGLPQAGETRVAFTNNHLGYAVTWYGLAAALLAVFAGFVRARLREGSHEPPLTQP